MLFYNNNYYLIQYFNHVLIKIFVLLMKTISLKILYISSVFYVGKPKFVFSANNDEVENQEWSLKPGVESINIIKIIFI